jgi:hypothetical protein
VQAFPEGFRMKAGGEGYEGNELAEDAVFVCVKYDGSQPPNYRVNTLDEVHSPCQQLQVRLGLPECYDGRPSSPNNRDHVTTLRKHGGRCPSSHPHLLPQLFFEFNYPWKKYAEEMPGSTFIFADGTKRQHADFLNGWDVNKLQQVVDQCRGDFDNACLARNLARSSNSAGCKINGQTLVREEINQVAGLPGLSGSGGAPAPAPGHHDSHVGGADTCESQSGHNACDGQECFTCGDRIAWLQKPEGGGQRQADARKKVGTDFPDECGACARTTHSCDAELSHLACDGQECFTCGDRISWLQKPEGGSNSLTAAREHVGQEFPDECGACAEAAASLFFVSYAHASSLPWVSSAILLVNQVIRTIH